MNLTFRMLLYQCIFQDIIDIKIDDALRVTILQRRPFEILDSGLYEFFLFSIITTQKHYIQYHTYIQATLRILST